MQTGDLFKKGSSKRAAQFSPLTSRSSLPTNCSGATLVQPWARTRCCWPRRCGPPRAPPCAAAAWAATQGLPRPAAAGCSCAWPGSRAASSGAGTPSVPPSAAASARAASAASSASPCWTARSAPGTTTLPPPDGRPCSCLSADARPGHGGEESATPRAPQSYPVHASCETPRSSPPLWASKTSRKLVPLPWGQTRPSLGQVD